MSLSANELNYLIWRYLQESGLELSAFALQDETKVDNLDSRYNNRIPTGYLVDLVQKGILYSKVNDMITVNNDTKSLITEDIVNLNFNLFSSIVDGDDDTIIERAIIPNNKVNDNNEQEEEEVLKKIENGEKNEQDSSTNTNTSKSLVEIDNDNDNDNDFTKVLTNYYTFPPSLSNDWNPSHPDVLAWGQRDSHSGICALIINEKTNLLTTELKLLPHPMNNKDIINISWCPKGHSLITSSENGELRLWDANGSIRFIMALHHSPVLTIKWSPNSSHILTLDITNKAIIWDSHTGQSIQLIDNNNNSGGGGDKLYGNDACWLDDYKFVLPGSKYSLLVYSLDSDIPLGILQGHLDSISNIIYNPNLKLLATCSDDLSIRIWKGNSINSLQIILGHSQSITYLNWIQLEYEDKGKEWFIISCSLDGSIRIWDIYKNKLLDLKLIDEGLPILTACLNKSGDKLVTGDSEGTVIVWEISQRFKKGDKLIKQLSCYQPELNDSSNNQNNNFISQLSWSLDGLKIAISYTNSNSCVVKI